jgi:phosphatidylglycerophosphatase A
MTEIDQNELESGLEEPITDSLPSESEYSVSEDIEARAKILAFSSPQGFLAFGFGSGLLTKAPGTMGTLAAVPIAVLLTFLDINGFWFLTTAFLAGIWICTDTSSRLGVEDYGGIVWDEMVAYWLIVAFIPFGWLWYLAAFIIFRGFDILKPWPISMIDERIHGGLGIMLDDVLAAIYTILILAFVNRMILGG